MDSSSSENFVKKKFEEHSTPYKNGWARKGEDLELEVSEICDVPISIRRTYRDVMVCNVVGIEIVG